MLRLLPAIAVEVVESAACACSPEQSVAVDGQGRDAAHGQTIQHEIGIPPAPVESGYTVLGREPWAVCGTVNGNVEHPRPAEAVGNSVVRPDCAVEVRYTLSSVPDPNSAVGIRRNAVRAVVDKPVPGDDLKLRPVVR